MIGLCVRCAFDPEQMTTCQLAGKLSTALEPDPKGVLRRAPAIPGQPRCSDSPASFPVPWRGLSAILWPALVRSRPYEIPSDRPVARMPVREDIPREGKAGGTVRLQGVPKGLQSRNYGLSRLNRSP